MRTLKRKRIYLIFLDRKINVILLFLLNLIVLTFLIVLFFMLFYFLSLFHVFCSCTSAYSAAQRTKFLNCVLCEHVNVDIVHFPQKPYSIWSQLGSEEVKQRRTVGVRLRVILRKEFAQSQSLAFHS